MATDRELVALGAATNLPRAAFEALFDELARDDKSGNVLPFKVIALLNPPGQNDFEACYIRAKECGWLNRLVAAVAQHEGFELDAAASTPSVPDLAYSAATGARSEPHAVIQKNLGFESVELVNRAGMRAERRVCRIVVKVPGGAKTGTGFLVGPQAVMTSFHVVRSQLDLVIEEAGAGGVAPGEAPPTEAATLVRYREKPESETRIFVEFDALDGFPSGNRFAVAKNWFIHGSPPDPSEDPENVAIDLTTAGYPSYADNLDYAIIQLVAAPGLERGFYRLDAERLPRLPPAPALNLTLFHHPGQDPMRRTGGTIHALWPNGVNTRLRHNANAILGSSGGLLLDFDQEPVALHQCGIIDAQGRGVINGAIPTSCIALHKRPQDHRILNSNMWIWRLPGTDQPVFGRDRFQEFVRDACNEVIRLIIVRSEDAGRKEFSRHILTAMLPSADHLVVHLLAQELLADPVRLVEAILQRTEPRTGVAMAGLPLGVIADADSTATAWINDTLYPAFIERLRQSAGAQVLWLLISGLDEHPLPVSGGSYLLDKLWSELPQLPFLRIVLLGLKGPAGGAEAKWTGYDVLAPVEIDDIVDYVERRCTQLDRDCPGAGAAILARTIINDIRRTGGDEAEIRQLIIERVHAEFPDPAR